MSTCAILALDRPVRKSLMREPIPKSDWRIEMRFFDLIQEHHGKRLLPHRVGEQAAFSLAANEALKSFRQLIDQRAFADAGLAEQRRWNAAAGPQQQTE